MRGEAAGRGCRLAGRVEAAAAVQPLQQLRSVRGHRHLGRQVAVVVPCSTSSIICSIVTIIIIILGKG